MATIISVNNNVRVNGTAEADLIYVDAVSGNAVLAGGGDDQIFGGAGGNTIFGGAGNDTIDLVVGSGFGDDGDDVLIARGHRVEVSGAILGSTLGGSAGTDRFVLTKDALNTWIADFESTEIIDLSNLPNTSPLRLTAGAAPYAVWIEGSFPFRGIGTTVMVNYDGTGDVNLVFYLPDYTAPLTESNFVFNMPPVAADVTVSGSEDAVSIAGSVSATDADGDPLSYSVSGSTPDGLVFNADGTFSYTPQASDQALNAGQSREVTFQYVANDGTVDSAVQTVTLSVQGADELITGDAGDNVLSGTPYNDIINTGVGADTVNLNVSTDGADQINTFAQTVFPSASGGASINFRDLTTTSSTLQVSGVYSGARVESVTLEGLSHGSMTDLDIYLESPTGQRIYLMSDAGRGNSNNPTNPLLNTKHYSFRDDGVVVTSSGDVNDLSALIVSFRPVNLNGAPDPSITTTGALLADFTDNPNGTWTLYAYDAVTGFTGSLSRWRMSFAPIPDGMDTINLSGADQIRLSFTSTEVGNNNAKDTNTAINQDGGLAVRIQAEDAMGELTGAVSRADDEGVRFVAASGTTLDIRDLVSGVARGDQFNLAVLGSTLADTIDESATSSNLYVNAGQGNDKVTGGSGHDFLVGGLGNDSLRSGGGDDWIDGGLGADSMVGGLGNDTYMVDDIADVVQELSNEGTDTVLSSINYRLGADVENLTITAVGRTGIGNVIANTLTIDLSASRLTGDAGGRLLGGGGNDTLNGAIGNDVLDGGVGADLMRGGMGDDVYFANVRGDMIVEDTDAGIDTVNSSVNWDLGDNLENLNLLGTGNIYAKGNSLDNVLTGNSGNNLLDGKGGADLLIGGAGSDTYQLNRGYGQNTIQEAVGASGTDTVQIGVGVRSNQVWFSRAGDDLQVTIIGTESSVLVEDWYAAGMSVESFRLANGQQLSASNVQSLVDAMAMFDAPSMGMTSLTAQQNAALGGVINSSWMTV